MTTYYIKNGGNDSADGFSDVNAWATLSKIASSSFSADDTICLNTGDIWREAFLLPSSGTVGHHIVLTSYGTGALPKILGSTALTSWTNVSGNVWKSDVTTNEWTNANIFFCTAGDNVHWGVDEFATYTGTGNLIAEYDWWWNVADSKIYIYSPTDPNTRYTAIEVQQRQYCIGLNGKEYITIDGIETRYFTIAGIYEKYPAAEWRGLTIRNCKSSYSCIRGGSVGYGFHVFHSDMLIENNVCHDNGRRNISCSPSSDDALTFSGMIVRNNELYNGYHTTGVDFGHAGNCNLDNIVINNNYIYHTADYEVKAIYGDPSEGVFVKNVSGITTRVYVYNNLFVNTIGSAVQFERVTTGYVYNNTMYGFHPDVLGGDGMLWMVNRVAGDVQIRNNIVYNNLPVVAGVYRYMLFIANDDIATTSDYNIYYDAVVTNRNDFLHNGGYTIAQWANWKSSSGGDSHSIITDPLFVSSSDYHLQFGSPAIGAGINVGLTTDYAGNLWSATPSIGAYEYVPTMYYIKNGGDDTKSGKDDVNAWATIAKVNASSFNAGDSILFNKGDVWREQLTIPSSGSLGNHITFGRFGTGVNPKILGSTQVISWTAISENIWVGATNVPDPYNPTFPFNGGVGYQYEIFFVAGNGDVTWGTAKKAYLGSSNFSNLTQEFDWTWTGNQIYVYSATDPDARYTSIEVPARASCIFIDDHEYITIDGIDMQFASARTVWTEYPQKNTTGLTIKNCHISYVGSRWAGRVSYGAVGYHLTVCRNDLLVQNNEIHDGGRRNTSVHVVGSNNLTFSNIIFEGNNLHDGYHSSGVGIINDDVETGNRWENIIVRNNLFWDNPNRNMVVDGFDYNQMCTIQAKSPGCTAGNVQIYNNIFKYNNNYGIWIDHIDGATIYNNTFYDFNKNLTAAITSSQIKISSGCTSIIVKNNIFYSTVVRATYPYAQNIVVSNGYTSQSLLEIELDYNNFYQSDLLMKIIGLPSVSYNSNEWATMKVATDWQSHEPGLVDPLFTSSSDYTLQTGSPAIAAGIGVGLVSDYAGNLWNVTPSIGAYEYGSSLTLTEGTWLANRTTLNAMYDHLYQLAGL